MMGYSLSIILVSEFSIVATENNTRVTITPRVETVEGQQPDKPFDVTLNRGDVYQVAAKYNPRSRRNCDLTGSHIVSNKTIAVFGGHQCSYVPERVQACNHLVEQMPPVQSWGKHFYIGKMEGRSNYTYRALGHYPDTRVFEDNQLIGTIGPGEYIERRPTSRVQLTASHPVLVAQYSHGYKVGDSIGDPMMLLISPTQQFLNKYRFATPVNGEWKHYINVVAPDDAIRTMTLNRRKIDPKIFHRIGISRYSIAYIEVPFGTHVIESYYPFGMYSYGFGFGEDAFDAYGTMGGQSFFEYVPQPDTLAPMAEAIDTIPGKMNIIIRDDRVDDRGIELVEIAEKINFNSKIPQYETGIQQVAVSAAPDALGEPGRLVIRTEDMAGNEAYYTICYIYNIALDEYVLNFQSGPEECYTDGLNSIGAFGSFAINMHNAGFSQTGPIAAPGTFDDITALNGGFGLYYGRRLDLRWQLSGRLSLNSYSGWLSAPDSIISHTWSHVDSAIVPYQESRMLSIAGYYAHLDFGAEYYLREYFYLTGGINLAISMSKSIDYKKRILIPSDFTFMNGEREIREAGYPEKLESLNSLNFGLFAGAGVNYPINYRIHAFGEAKYIYYPGDLTGDASWSIRRLEFLLGIKYKF